jgi:hypothetical protein
MRMGAKTFRCINTVYEGLSDSRPSLGVASVHERSLTARPGSERVDKSIREVANYMVFVACCAFLLCSILLA